MQRVNRPYEPGELMKMRSIINSFKVTPSENLLHKNAEERNVGG